MKTYNILTIEEFKKNIDNNSRLLGMDPGKKNIGIAICDENKIKGVVIGNPINMDGSLGKASQSATGFAKNLSISITIPIVLWDERLSSEGSFKITRNLGTNVTDRVKKLDKNAAAFILQGAIDFLSN